MKKILVLLVLAGLIGGGAYYWHRNEAKAAAANTPQYTESKVERGSITQSVATTGRVIANRDVDIKCKASGQIITLPFDISDEVSSGDLILELDPVDETRAVRQAEVKTSATTARLAQAYENLRIAERNLQTERARGEAALNSAKAKSADARAKADRMKQLLAKELASQEEFDSAQTAAVQATTELSNAQVKLEELKTQEISLELKRQDCKLAETDMAGDRISLANAQQRLRETKVYSPIDGWIAVRSVQIGQIIASGVSNVGGGTTIMTISDLSRIFVIANVDESDIGKVEVGQRAVITADAFPTAMFEGKVLRIATRGANVSNVVTFEVRIEVLSKNKDLLKPEMTTNVEIIAADRQDTLIVPAEAVSRRRGGQFVLVRNDDGTSEPQTVEVGISDGFRTEVLTGLEEGQTVVALKGQSESRWRGGPGGPGGPGGSSSTRMMMMGGGGGSSMRSRGGPR